MSSAITLPHAVPDALVFGDPQLHTDGDVLALAFSLVGADPASPGGTLWSVEDPGVVRQWNPATGQEIAWHSPSELEDLWCFSPDARLLASAANDLALWDTATGALLTVVPQPEWVTAVAFAPCGGYLATGHDDGAVRHWDAGAAPRGDACRVEPRRLLRHEFRRHTDPISAVAYSADGRRLAAAGEDRIIHLWDLQLGQHLGALEGHTDRIPALVWHPDGRHLISAGWDTTARVWDTHTLEPVILLNAHAAQVYALALSRDGSLLACADSDHAVYVWDFAARKVLHTIWGAARDVRSLTFSADGARLAFGGGDRLIHIWDPRTGQPLSSQGAKARSRPALALSPDGRRVASNGGGSAPRVWRVPQGSGTSAPGGPEVTLEGTVAVHALAWSPDGKLIAGGTDEYIALWDADSGKVKAQLDGFDDPVTVAAFSPDGSLLATASASGMPVWIWRVSDGEPILLIPDPLEGCTVESLAFHPNGKILAVGGIDWLATGGSDGAVSLWDLEQRCEIATYLDGATAVAFDPSGQRLAIALLEHEVNVFDVATERLAVELSGHEGVPACVAFSPDGRLLATGGEDRTLRLWDARTGEEISTRELDTQVRALAFSPDGKHVFTANANTTCYRLDVS